MVFRNSPTSRESLFRVFSGRAEIASGRCGMLRRCEFPERTEKPNAKFGPFVGTPARYCRCLSSSPPNPIDCVEKHPTPHRTYRPASRPNRHWQKSILHVSTCPLSTCPPGGGVAHGTQQHLPVEKRRGGRPPGGGAGRWSWALAGTPAAWSSNERTAAGGRRRQAARGMAALHRG